LQNEINRQYSDIRHNIPKQIQDILVDKENRVTEYKFIVKSIDANKEEADLSVACVYYAWADNPVSANLQDINNHPVGPFRVKL